MIEPIRCSHWDVGTKERICADKINELIALSAEKAEKCPLTKEFIQEHYDEFLGYYYNSPCSGCKDGHPSFWKTIIESEEWKSWKATNPIYDFAECEELGIMGKEHFKAFIEFIKGKPSAGGVSKQELCDIIVRHIPYVEGKVTDKDVEKLAHAIMEGIG